jgi:hypothetical protein
LPAIKNSDPDRKDVLFLERFLLVQPAAMPLYRTAYKSAVSKPITKTELRQILKSSQDNNYADNVTGALLFDSGIFLQVLEGKRGKINSLLARLTKDPRHSNIELIGLEPIEKRQFETWSMGLIESNSITKAILLKYCGADRPDVEQMTLADVTEMMLTMLGRTRV